MFYCDIYSDVAWFMTVKIQIYNSVLITQCLKMEFTDNHQQNTGTCCSKEYKKLVFNHVFKLKSLINWFKVKSNESYSCFHIQSWLRCIAFSLGYNNISYSYQRGTRSVQSPWRYNHICEILRFSTRNKTVTQ